MSPVTNKRIALAAGLGLLGAFAIYLWTAFYPGILTVDSFFQLRQARSSVYNDQHPPIMAALWHLLLPLSDGPVPMLFLQFSVYFLAFALLFIHLINRGLPYVAFFVVLASLLPFYSNFVGVIWKDVHNAYAWFLAVVLILFYPAFCRKFIFVPAILLWYGWVTRGNAILAILPLLWMLIGLWDISKKRLSVLTLGVFVAFFAVKIGITDVILKPSHTSSYARAMVHDLSGIKHFGGEPTLPETLIADNPNLAEQMTSYESYGIRKTQLRNPLGNIRVKAETPAARDQIKSAWIQSIKENPLPYVKHRLGFVSNFLHIGHEGASGTTAGINERRYGTHGVEIGESRNRDRQTAWVKSWGKTPFMRGYFWFSILSIAFLVSAVRLFKHGAGPTLLISMSGLLHLGPHFVFGQAPNFRYFYWAIFAASLILLWWAVIAIERRFGQSDLSVD